MICSKSFQHVIVVGDGPGIASAATARLAFGDPVPNHQKLTVDTLTKYFVGHDVVSTSIMCTCTRTPYQYANTSNHSGKYALLPLSSIGTSTLFIIGGGNPLEYGVGGVQI